MFICIRCWARASTFAKHLAVRYEGADAVAGSASRAAGRRAVQKKLLVEWAHPDAAHRALRVECFGPPPPQPRPSEVPLGVRASTGPKADAAGPAASEGRRGGATSAAAPSEALHQPSEAEDWDREGHQGWFGEGGAC